MTATTAHDEPVSILFVCQGDLGGPSEKQIMGFAQRLAGRGHRVLLSLGGSTDSIAREGLQMVPGIELTEHRFSGRRLRPGDRQRGTEFAPMLIHAVNSRVPTAAAAADYSRATGAPVLVHFEDNEWQAWHGVPGESVYHRVGRHVRRVESIVHPDTWPHSTAATRRWVRRRSMALDALTPELATEVSARIGRPCSTLLPVSPMVVADGAGAAFEPPASLVGVPLAVVTGTIYPFSLEDTLQGLEAVAEVQRRGHDVGYVHPGNVHARIDPEALATGAGLREGTFAFPGLLPYSNMAALLRGAAVLLQPGGPSEFNRLRLPSKLQSYLASGTPTITFAVGFGGLLADREEVLKVSTASPGELADRIEEVLTDGDLRLALTEGGPRAARRLFDPERNTDALLSHYRKALISSSAQRGRL
jgi:glycosyltransferase involved in cell wall biosynthesis